MNKSSFFIAVSFALMTLLISCSSEKVIEGQEIFVEVSSETRKMKII